ncbi:hypothetical protein ABMA74_12030 [Halobacteriovorax sp. HFRX-1_3]
MEVLGGFSDHDSFDGMMFGYPEENYHIEYTVDNNSPITPTPTNEDLLVFYYPDENEYLEKLNHIKSIGYERKNICRSRWLSCCHSECSLERINHLIVILQ